MQSNTVSILYMYPVVGSTPCTSSHPDIVVFRTDQSTSFAIIIEEFSRTQSIVLYMINRPKPFMNRSSHSCVFKQRFTPT